MRPVGERTPGDWGGIIIIGNGTINRTGGNIQTEGGAAGESENYAGGTDDNDDPNDDDDQALLKHFGILGPPTIVFFGADGRERSEYRIVGFKPADEFRAHLAGAFGVAT